MDFVKLMSLMGAVLGSMAIAGGNGSSLIWMLTILMWIVFVVSLLVKP